MKPLFLLILLHTQTLALVSAEPAPTPAEKSAQEAIESRDLGVSQNSLINTLVLAAEAHLSVGKPTNCQEVVKICDMILASEDVNYEVSNRSQFLKGSAYELLKKPRAALECYCRVVNRENLSKGEEPKEWEWYAKCGFNAAGLLEANKRWRPAIKILKKLGESKSPRAREAAQRARDLQVKHLIWNHE